MIREESLKDSKYTFLWQQVINAHNKGKKSKYGINHDNLLTFGNQIYISNQNSIKQAIMDGFRRKSYDAHPGYQK